MLCDEHGTPTGTAEKWSSHHDRTPLHLAFSCYVFDDAGAFLTTRRAATKKVWPGVWTNTACGHPAPGESFPDAIARRIDYELGMTVRDIEVVLPDHLYRAPAYNGIVEHEFCPVFVARGSGVARPNAIEVGACAWLAWDEFVRRADTTPATATRGGARTSCVSSSVSRSSRASRAPSRRQRGFSRNVCETWYDRLSDNGEGETWT